MVREEHNLTPSPPLNSPVGAAPEQRGAEESSPSHGTVHRDELLRSSGKRSGFKNLRILSRKKRPADSYRQCNYIFLDQDTELLSDIVPNDASAPFIADLPLLPPQEALNAKDPCSNVVSSNDSKAYQPMLREGGGRNPTVPNDHVGDAVDVTTAHAHQGVSISTDQNPFGYGVRLKSSIASLSSQFKTRSCWNDTLGSLTNEHRSKRYRHMTTGNSGLQHASHSAEDDMDVEAAYERDHTKVGEPTDQEGFTPTYSGPPSNTAHHANHYPLRSADGLSTYHDNNAMPLFMQPEDAQQTTNEYETTRETQTCWRPLSFFFFLTRLPARWRSQPRYTDASSQRPSNGSLDNSTGIPHDMEDVHVASVPTSTQRGWIQRVRVPSLRSALAERYDSVRTRLAATRERARAVIVERFAGLHEAAGNEDHDVNASGLPMHDDPSYQQLIWFMGILFGPLIFVLGAFLYFLTPRELHKTRLWGFINIVFGSLSLMSFLLNSYQEVPLPASDRVAIYDTVKHFTGHDVFMGGSGSLWVPSSSDASQWTQGNTCWERPPRHVG